MSFKAKVDLGDFFSDLGGGGGRRTKEKKKKRVF